MDQVKMDYELVERSAAAFRSNADQLRQVEVAVRRIAQVIDDSAYVNRQGAQWSNALRGYVTGYLQRVQAVLEETAQDLLGAMHDLQEGDQTSARTFGG